MKNYAVAAAAAVALAGSAQAATVFAVDENNNLVTFNSAAPGVLTSTRAITGTAATFLALDFRDSNGLLYGLADDLRLYTIDTTTGLASAVGGPLALTGTNFGFDFNTAIDALRIVSNDDSNYVVNPNTGTLTTVATPVFYAPGDPNAGVNPTVTANAYIHGTPTQFAIDTNADFLVRQANNAGTLTSVGSLGVAVGPRTSFDIDFDGVGYILDADRFYTVNLNSGTATLVGTTATPLFGMAIQAVPEPATWAMMVIAFGLIGGVLRRHRASVRAVALQYNPARS
jgi:hypothetical protein